MTRFAVIGHDWGGRAAYAMAAMQPERLAAIAALAIGYAPRRRFVTPGFEPSRRWWYQWYMTTEGGADRVRADPISFARLMWQDWSPPGSFDEAAFAHTADSFRHPDWAAITLHGYRSRWRDEPLDPTFAAARAAVDVTETLAVPTLIIQGGEDRCDPPSKSERQERWFTRGFRRVMLDGVGHFPAREDAGGVAAAIVDHLGHAGWAAARAAPTSAA